MSEDIRDIESVLGRYRPAGPNPGLRSRIVRQARWNSRGFFWEAAAALVLIGLNLAQMGASVRRFTPAPLAEEARTQRIAMALANLDLPMSSEETRGMTVRLAAADRLVPQPSIHGPGLMALNLGALP